MTRPMQRTVLLLGALLLSMLAAACAPAPAPTAAPPEVQPSPTALALPSALPTTAAASTQPAATEAPAAAGEVTGASLYQLSCAACHGNDRAGNEFEDEGQKISVPELTWDDLSKMYSTDPSRGSVADQLALAITQGKSEDGGDLEPMMPKWSSLSKAQVDSLIAFLQNPPTTTAGAPTLAPEAAALQGEQLYVAACAACHGADGAGKTFESDGNTIETPSLKWSDLSGMYTETSRGTLEDQIALAITKGQDEEGGELGAMMPRWSFLTQEQVQSLVQYLQTAFK